jgi:uncharacterized Zn finger protein (UPF0148 family)
MVEKVTECPKCGGISWKAVGGQLICEYCGYIKSIDEQAEESLSSKDAAELLISKQREERLAAESKREDMFYNGIAIVTFGTVIVGLIVLWVFVL